MATNYTSQLPACGLTTRDADDVVLTLRAQGKTYHEIANVLGVSYSSARRRHFDAERRRGVSVFKPSEIARRLEHRKMLEEGNGR